MLTVVPNDRHHLEGKYMPRSLIAILLAVSLAVVPKDGARAQNMDRAVGAVLGAIIGGAVREHQRSRPQQPRGSTPAISTAQRQETRELQAALNFFEFNAGSVDGVMGPNTRRAIRSFQRHLGFRVTGRLDEEQRAFLLDCHRRAERTSAQSVETRILRHDGPQALLLHYHSEAQGSAIALELPDRAEPAAVTQTREDLPPLRMDGAARSREAYACLRQNRRADFRACLEDAGESEATIAAAMALTGDGSPTLLTNYFAIGPVDVAQTETLQAGSGTFFGLVRDNREFLSAESLFEPMLVHDRASRSLQRRHPQAAALNAAVVSGHRYMANATQRFVLTAPITDGCRGCDLIATAIGYVDFRHGRLVDSGTIGWLPLVDARRGLYGPALLNELRRGNVAALQAALNLRGYVAGAMDSAMGPNTRRALHAFQQDHCQRRGENWRQHTAEMLAGTGEWDEALTHIAACGPPPALPSPSQTYLSGEYYPGVPLPLREGIYASEARYCDPDSPDRRDIGDAFSTVLRPYERNIFSYYEAYCGVRDFRQVGEEVEVSRFCEAEGYYERSISRLRIHDETSFSDQSGASGEAAPRFTHCDILTDGEGADAAALPGNTDTHWSAQYEPDALLGPGGSGLGIIVDEAGDVTWSGTRLFAHRPTGTEQAQVAVFRSPDGRHLAVFDVRPGGEAVQLAVVGTSPEASDIITDVLPAANVARQETERNHYWLVPAVAWSPSGDRMAMRVHARFSEDGGGAEEKFALLRIAQLRLAVADIEMSATGPHMIDLGRIHQDGDRIEIPRIERDCDRDCAVSGVGSLSIEYLDRVAFEVRSAQTEQIERETVLQDDRIDSVYSDLHLERNCTLIGRAHEYSAQLRCEGVAGHEVLLTDAHHRFFLRYQRQDADASSAIEPTSGWVTPAMTSFSGFNHVGDVVEWRRAETRGEMAPFATIQRWFVSSGTGAEHQVLVVSTVAREPDDESCMVGYVDASATSQANQVARQIADERAREFDCGEDEVQPYGTITDQTPHPMGS